jgi:predicted DNA-binding ribbon-helix-helix protein
LEKPVYNALHDLAENEGVSMSMLMRDLVKEGEDPGDVVYSFTSRGE